MRWGALCAIVLCAAACSPREMPPPPIEAPPAPPRVAANDAELLLVGAQVDASTVHGEVHIPVVSVEVASSYAARQRGLGGRETLADGHGMLFVYPDAAHRTFWMKDCLIALDIAFLDSDGSVHEIVTLPPGAGLESEAIPAHSCAQPSRYVLEVRARWFGENGIHAGDRIDLANVVEDVVAE